MGGAVAKRAVGWKMRNQKPPEDISDWNWGNECCKGEAGRVAPREHAMEVEKREGASLRWQGAAP